MYNELMKTFFNKKRIAYLSIICVTLLIMIIILIVPIGSLSDHCLCFSIGHGIYTNHTGGKIADVLTSPFVVARSNVLFFQTLVFALLGATFVVFTVLFAIELKRAHICRPTKAARLQAQVDDLQKQIDELKKGE